MLVGYVGFVGSCSRAFPSHEEPTYDAAVRQGLCGRRSQVTQASRVAVHHALLSQLSFQLLLARSCVHSSAPRFQIRMKILVEIAIVNHQLLVYLI